jgi:PAS domain S-box-containing protein
VDQAPIAIFRLNNDAVILDVNPQAVLSLGDTREELIGTNLFTIAPLFSVERWREHRGDITEGDTRVIDTVHRRKDGNQFPVESHLTAGISGGGACVNPVLAQDSVWLQVMLENMQNLRRPLNAVLARSVN